MAFGLQRRRLSCIPGPIEIVKDCLDFQKKLGWLQKLM